jgi:hypothetical protein
MSWKREGAAAVVVAQQFNPSVVSQMWLVRNGLLAEEDFLKGCFFSDVVVQVRSRQFALLIIPEQLQFIPAVSQEEEQALIADKVGRIVRTLPHTPFRALGLNFTWHLTPRDGDIARVTRALFFRDGSPLYRCFESEDAHFGGFLSKHVLGFRLNLDVKPIQVQEGERQEGRVQFAFNFHLDLGDNAAQRIEEYLLLWNEVRQEAGRIIDAVEQREQA